MKLTSWNVNGIRAAGRNGFIKWFEDEAADVVAIQEAKARPDQLVEDKKDPGMDKLLHPLGYHSYWHPAEKPGYSGVAIYSKKEPLKIITGIGSPEIDREGRVIAAEYADFTLVNAYFPNSQREGLRLGYKLEFCRKMHTFLEGLRKQGKQIVVCGDFNIAHNEIDLKNPKTNTGNAGFLPEERAWMSEFLGAGYIDAFRHFEKGPGHYTWWSYRPGIRERNIGWRIDYFCVNREHEDRLKAMVHQPQTKGSDHCPVTLTLRS
jgi:exodeoxyribonuclease-3